MKRIKKYSLLVLVLSLSFIVRAQIASRYYKEDFNNLTISEWKTLDNSSQKTSASRAWVFGTPSSTLGAVGAPREGYTSNNRNTYAHVGFIEKSDQAGAIMSKWLISPEFFFKNGDKIQFWTKQRLNNCQSPNRLEVRLSAVNLNQQTFPIDSTRYVGTGADDYGAFKIHLKTINPDNVPGTSSPSYPSNWTLVECVISGLPNNEMFKGRVGFWYHFSNAGTNAAGSCITPLFIPADKLQTALPPVQSVIEMNDAFGNPMADAASATLTLWNDTYQSSVSNSTGRGTAIAIDDFEIIPKENLFIFDQSLSSNAKSLFFDQTNITQSSALKMGHRAGDPYCRIDLNTPTETRLTIQNTTNQIVKVKPNIAALYGTDMSIELISTDSISIPANGSAPLLVKIKSGIPVRGGQPYFAKVWITDKNGVNRGEAKINVYNESAGAPIAKCKEFPDNVTLDANGTTVLLPYTAIDDGSTNGCGTTSALSFVVSKETSPGVFAYNDNSITCSDAGLKNFRLTVRDENSSTTNVCYSTVRVIVPNATINQSFVQNYYIGNIGSGNQAMPIASVAKPPITSGCASSNLEVYAVNGNSVPSNLGVGQYVLSWKIPGETTSYVGTTTLNVLDTIKPVLNNNSASIGFVGYLRDYATGIYYRDANGRLFDYVLTSFRAEDLGVLDYAQDNSYINNGTFNFRKGITNLEMSTPSHNGGAWTSTIPINCGMQGQVLPVTIKAYDASGNFKTAVFSVSIQAPTNPVCKNIEVELTSTSGEPSAYVTPSQILNVSSTVVCGSISDLTISKSVFSCSDVGITAPVTVTWKNNIGTTFSCTGSVKVKPFVLEQANCTDTLKVVANVTNVGASVTLPKVFESKCNNYLPIQVVASGATNFTTSSTVSDYNAIFGNGITDITRSIVYNGQTLTCAQKLIVIDTIKPLIIREVNDTSIVAPFNQYDCGLNFTIKNIFNQGTYKHWGYQISGDTTLSDDFQVSNYDDQHWNDKEIELYPGNFTIRLYAYDYVGNGIDHVYTLNYSRTSDTPPGVYATEFASNPTFVGQTCDSVYKVSIASPINTMCNPDPYMWYYEVRDSYLGNIIFDMDSISEFSGAEIPLRVGLQYNLGYFNVVHLGYHNRTNGARVLSSTHNVTARDQINTYTCPKDTTIINTNNTTFDYNFQLKSPVATCQGSFWGYNIAGATNVKTLPQNINYTDQQDFIFSNVLNYNEAYPTVAYNNEPTITLKNGINTVKYSMIEPSGHGQTAGNNLNKAYNTNGQYINGCKFTINLIDGSAAAMTCPEKDTIIRSDLGSCDVNALQSCQQINGFTGPYGTGRIKLQGANTKIELVQNDKPNSITLKSINTGFINNSGYVTFKVNCAGTISFNWEYQAADPYYFRPFITKSLGNNDMTGYLNNSTAVQNGTYSVNVVAGETVYVGLFGSGGTSGYFKITNFSAPSAAIVAELKQPTFNVNDNLYFTNNVQATYPIGNHQVIYTLQNVKNGSRVDCYQDLIVLDAYAGSLSCQDKTVYLDENGQFILTPDQIISTCFDVSNTTMSMDTLSCADIGTHAVTINSFDKNNNPIDCTFNLTVIDNTGPQLSTSVYDFVLDDFGNTATLTEAQMLEMIQDPCGIQSVTANESNISCSEAGLLPIQLTATDNNGNTSVLNLSLNVRLNGFSDEVNNNTYQVCQNEPFNVYTEALGNSYSYYWQKKDKLYDSLSWNFYTSDRFKKATPNPLDYKFIKDFKRDYNLDKKGAYLISGTGNDPKEVFELEPISERWNKTNISFNNPSANYLPIKTDEGDLLIVNIRNDNYKFEFIKYVYSNNTWVDLTGSLATWDYNLNYEKVYGKDNYFFLVNSDGNILGGKALGSSYNVHYDLHNVDSDYNTLFVTNAKNLVGIRNSLNQNIFLQMNLYPDGSFTQTKDSITVDPTGGSDLFSLHSFNDEAYIAYKSSNGKACVKKYTGSSTWSNVGSLDFSSGTISKVDLYSYNDTLYVMYIESGTQINVKKFDGTNWKSIESPNDNLSIADVEKIQFVNLTAKPQLHIENKFSNFSYFISLEGWRNVYANTSNSSNNYYSVPTNVLGTETYRCISKNTNACASHISGLKTVEVQQRPTIQVNDISLFTETSASLLANTDIGTVKWYNDRNATSLESFVNPNNLDNITSTKTFYAISTNGVCNSDTVAATVYVNDVNIPAIGIIAPDSVCGGDQHLITLDTTQYISDLVYTLYQKDANDEFIEVPNSSRSVNYFNVDVDETTTFKVLVRENQNNATTFYNLYDDRFIDFGDLNVSSDDEITIEAWMEVQNFGEVIPPANFFQLSNALSYGASNTDKNFEWIDGYFKVYNGSGTRWCAFPALPVVQNSTWMHVATTAGPSGLKIYYNGVLVASNNTAAASPINNGVHTLKLGKAYPDQEAPWGMGGLDEFRLWQRQRTQTEIQENMNVCLPDDAANLIIVNNFSDLDVANKTFNSVIGNDALVETAGQPVHGAYREDQCTPNPISKRFLPEFTIYVYPNQGAITYSQNYPYSVYDEQTEQTTSNKILQCGPVFAPVKATATSGQISWYTHETGGSLITTGSEVNIYADKDTIIYVASSPQCKRYEVSINIIEYPEIFKVNHDTICVGDEYNDIYIDVPEYSDETDDWDVYLEPTGGTPFDYRFDYTVLTEDDTLYLEAYNQYCTASTRVPFYVHIFKGVELNLPDYSYCGEGQVDFTLQYPSLEGFTWFTDQDVYIDWVNNGDVFSTPVLTDTTTYKVEPYHYNGGCYGEKEEITINVTPYKIQRDSILSCEPITWLNGQTYNQSVSEVVLTRPQTEGCDSVYYLNLKVSDLLNKYVIASASGACIGQTVAFTIYDSQNGKSYALVDLISGDTINKVKGDGNNLSIETTPLTADLNVKVVAIDSLVNPTDLLVCEKTLGTFPLKAGESIANTTIVTCDSYEWGGTTYTTSGVYEDTLTSVYGCDSILRLHLTINQSYNDILNVVACESYTWRGNTYTSSQQVVHRFGFTPSGCDSLQTLNLTIGQPTTGTDVITACDAYTWIDGITYTSNNNTATFVVNSSAGCDSTVTLNLTIKNSTTGTDVISACDSYTWIDGNTYTSSNNTATHVLTNAAGCDSTVTLNLTIKNSTTGTDVISACTSYTWIDGNTYTSSNNTATHVLTNAAGCDSTVTLNLTIKNSTTGTDVISACGSYTWIDGNTYTASNNTATHVLTNAAGCDSTVTLNLTIKNSTTGTDVISACTSYTWIDGNTYTSSNNSATHVLTNAAGCDSTVTLNLTIKNSTTGTDVISACDSYTWIDGNTYTSSNNTATHILTNAAGCDSTVTLNLTINNTPNADVLSNVSACGSYTLPALTVGNYYTGSGGTGTALIAGDVITSSQTIYVYAETGTTPNCSDENSFTITILACSTQLASGSCGKQLSLMSDALYSDPVNGASNYRYEIRKQSDNSLVTVSTRGVNDNLFRLSWVNASLIQYNTTYSIKVAAYVNGSWMSYGTACDVTTPILTKLSDASCNVSIPVLSTALYSDAVIGASNYRYEIRKQSDNSLVTVSTRGVNDNLFRLSWVNSSLIQYNTTYSIKVAAYVNGSWMPYGTACTVSTPKITKLDPASCGISIASTTQALYCEVVSGATNYRYEVRKQSDNSLISVSTRGSSDNLFRLSWVSGVQLNTSYSIKVAAYVNGNWQEYGPSCIVTTLPVTKLANTSCNVTIGSLSSALYAESLAGATNYRYEIRKQADNSLVGVSVRGSSDTLFRLSWVSGVQLNTTYSIKVAAYINGMWTSYGTACTVSTSAAIMADEEVVQERNNGLSLGEELLLEAFPNPNSGNFTLRSNAAGRFQLTNELGQVIRTIEISEETKYQTTVEGLSQGVYFINTKKIVVQ